MHNESRKPAVLFLSLPVLAWALFDFANTIFSANIVTLFFPQYITEIIGTNAQLEQISSTVIAYANAASALFLILFSPLFGVLMDRSGKRKKYIIIYTADSCGIHTDGTVRWNEHRHNIRYSEWSFVNDTALRIC